METDIPHDGGALRVQVMYARRDSAWHRTLTLPAGATAADALLACSFRQAFPDYPHAEPSLGIYGRACGPDHPLADGDRLEIYRPLAFDAMESRRRRALHRRAAAASRTSARACSERHT